MQIRTTRKTIRLLRSVYDPSIKRCRQETVTTIPAGTALLPPDVEAMLTGIEVSEVKHWLWKREFIRERDEMVSLLESAPAKLTMLAKSIDEFETSKHQAFDMYQGIKKVRSALRKKGLSESSLSEESRQ